MFIGSKGKSLIKLEVGIYEKALVELSSPFFFCFLG
jgi:hypothetical protein